MNEFWIPSITNSIASAPNNKPNIFCTTVIIVGPNLEANFELDNKLEAPLAKGQVVGKLYLQLDGEDVASYPLVTLQEVKEGSFFNRAKDYIMLQLGFDDE